MAGNDNRRTVEQVQREVESEREQLAGAADSLRESFDEATDIGGKLRANLPAAAAGALGLGFLLAGGVGATARLIFAPSREDQAKFKVGRFRLGSRD
jgi:NaMN:DMB phosphoribosyltransferase